MMTYDLAEILEKVRNEDNKEIVDSINPNLFWYAQLEERKRIINILEDRIVDLRSCTKDDNCQDLAEIIAVCIEDINDPLN
jgi:hypothetical protein